MHVAIRKPNYYSILGVARTADQRTIRSAYRRLARQFHPDIANSPAAETPFLLIQEAYETLSDPEKRRQYDLALPWLPFRNNRKGSAVRSSVTESKTGFAIDALGIRFSAGWSVRSLSSDDESD
jgi:DnaJ-class molecular chaperone